MSLIHKALDQSGNRGQLTSNTSFNPLDRGPTSNNRLTLIALSVVLVAAITTVLLWPVDTSDPELITTPLVTENEPTRSIAETTQPSVPESTEPSATTQKLEHSESTEKPATVSTTTNRLAATTVEQAEVQTKGQTLSPDSEIILVESISEATAQVNAVNKEGPNATEPSAQTQTVAPTDEAQTQDSPGIAAVEARQTDTTIVTRSSNVTSITDNTTPSEPMVTPSPDAPSPNNQGSSSISITQSTPATNEITPANPQTTGPSVIVSSAAIWADEVEAHIAKDEIELAEVDLKRWISAAPKDPRPRIWLARIYINNGVERAAEPLLINLSSIEAQGLLGIVYERTNRSALAAAVFENLYRQQSNNGRWLLFWAINSERAGEFEKSQQLYQTYLNLFSLDDPNLTAFAEGRLNT